MARRDKFPLLENIQIERMAAEGKCLTHAEGRAVFVPFTAPGDIVDIKVTKARKKHWEGKAVAFHHLSEQRTEPFCEHFGICGGCKWQHIPYEQQLAYKRQQVIDQFERIGKVALPEVDQILPSQATRYYRNKLEYAFSDQRWFTREEIATGEALDKRALGFHIPGSFEKILPINHCYLQPDPSNDIRLAVDQYAKEHQLPYYNMRQHTGILRTLLIRTANTGEVMVMVQFGRDAAEAPEVINELMQFLREKFPMITSLQYVINKKMNDTFYDLEMTLYAGRPYITEQMENLQFRVSAQSFYQTNSDQAYHLYKTTRDFAQLGGQETVYDLYSGTGTIANFIAAQAKQVVGIEYVEQAIEDAHVNSRINDIHNTSFFAGDMRELLKPEFLDQHGRPDVIITDPPRVGMHADVVNQLLGIEAPRIVYVSCNPATQARDIALLDEKYKVEKLQPVDMFPHTHHVENVALLTLR
uniref:23S rRNA (Uracil(1939)-C(5))-methyltransferase RlmD n=1 Tax=Roseihalotalea indica TaxID=2867963 RepID=A0AA49GPP2_9BACT|nr:23S rRNA (uracil(1939)-C(5))-methyltransferase RlmD [Tunicatimonas sp. TK19036]